MNIHVYLSILVVYFLGFIGMYFYSLKSRMRNVASKEIKRSAIIRFILVCAHSTLLIWIVVEKLFT